MRGASMSYPCKCEQDMRSSMAASCRKIAMRARLPANSSQTLPTNSDACPSALRAVSQPKGGVPTSQRLQMMAAYVCWVFVGMQVLVSAGHYMECIEIAGGQVDIVGNGNMQHILLDAPAGASAIVQQGGAVRISNMMLRSNRFSHCPVLSSSCP